MGLLAKCPNCSTTYMPGGPCPSCNYREPAEGESAASERDIAHEFAWRKFWHYLAYAAWMCRGLAGGLVGVAAIGSWFWGLGGALVLMIFAAAVAVVAQLVLFAIGNFRTLRCPACETRLDELPMTDDRRCAGCRVRLM